MRLVNRRRMRGFSLIEVLVALTILGILAAKGFPALSNYLANARIREGANAVIATAALARNEAIKRNLTVTLASDGQALKVTVGSGGAATVLKTLNLPDATRVAEFTASFDSAGRLLPFGTEVQAQVSGLDPAACGEDVRCPTVRLESGGAVSLCKAGACT